jgi:septum formation protein
MITSNPDPGLLKNLKLVLASRSPRRQEILKNLGLEFEIRLLDTDETIIPGMNHIQAAEYLAEKKAMAVAQISDPEDIIIGADTIVYFAGEMLGKPIDADEAKSMLLALSGEVHTVVTGVAIAGRSRKKVFHHLSEVRFKELSDAEIDFYVDNFKPFDKAGSYGIQDWMGLAGVEKIEGSFFNVMGLPAKELYERLFFFC